MTRRPFGGGPADVAATVDGSGRLEVARNAWVTVYTASTGGVVADLLAVVGGAPVSAGRVGTDAFGMIGSFSGPDDGSSVLWGDAGSGDRVRMDTTDLPGRVTTLETETSGEALQSALTAEISRATTAEALLVPQTRTVNGHPLTGNVTVSAADVGAAAAAPVQSVAGKTGAVSLVKSDVGLSSVDNTSDAAKPISTATATALAAKADLVGGVIPTSQIPALAISDTFTAASQAAMLALTAQRGDVAIRTDLNPQRAYMLTADDVTVLGNWLLISDPTAAVTSVNGQTGVAVLAAADVGAVPTTRTVAGHALSGDVSLVKADVGLGSVDNTADSAKPVSTAQAAADATVLASAHTYADAAVSTQHTADNGTYAPQSTTPVVIPVSATFGDGVTDATAAIQAALNAANTAGGGLVYLPAGTFLVSSPLTIYSNTRLVGSGAAVTIIKLANSANCDLLVSNGFAGLTGGGTSGGVARMHVSHLTLDGNKANNASGGAGIKHYGALCTIEHVTIRNCKTDGIYSEWSSSAVLTDGCEGLLLRVIVHDCGGNGIVWAGPHDSLWNDVVVFSNGAHGVWVKSSASVLVATACHVWGTTHDYAWYLEGVSHLDGCQGEGASVAQVFVGINNCQINGGSYFAAGGNNNVKGIVIGDSSTHASIAGTRVSSAHITGCLSGALDVTNSTGNGFIIADVNQASGAAIVGSVKTNELVQVNVTGGATGWTLSLPQQVTVAAGGSNALLVQGSNAKLNVNASAGRIELVNAADLVMYSDNFSTVVGRIYGAGGVAQFSAVTRTGENLTSGDETCSRLVAQSVAIGLTSQQLALTYFTARKTETINNVRLLSGNTAAAATPTLARIGIYSVDASGNLTLVASTASDTALFAASSTIYTKALSASWSKVMGTTYALGVLVVSATTMPKLVGLFPAGGFGAETATAPRIAGAVSGQADLPGSVAVGSVSNFGGMVYAAVTP